MAIQSLCRYSETAGEHQRQNSRQAFTTTTIIVIIIITWKHAPVAPPMGLFWDQRSTACSSVFTCALTRRYTDLRAPGKRLERILSSRGVPPGDVGQRSVKITPAVLILLLFLQSDSPAASTRKQPPHSFYLH
ncbi:hypothetical protein QQF64_034902 [Cirrhinus molitorella]|uniref:Uncharacterized protein n=1 Tax=Cirrhinus molitorella TaxID=172907 RepID=A0ABR3NE81_9TELE